MTWARGSLARKALPFVECRVGHDNHASGQKLRHQVLRHPCIENVGGDIGYEQAYGQQRLSDQGANDISSAPCMPIFYAMGALTHWRIAMRAWHAVRKAAFIKVNNDAAFSLIAFNFFLKDAPLFFAGFGVAQAFFISHIEL